MSQEQFSVDVQKQRNQLLKAIYDLSSANPAKFVLADDISPLMDGKNINQLFPLSKYLDDKGLVKLYGDGWFITTAGIDAVEKPYASRKAILAPTAITHNTIHAPNFTQGAIQQNANNSTQTVNNTSTVTNPDLGPLIEKLLAELPQQSISVEDKEEIETLLRTLKQQGKKAEPNTSLVAEAVKSFRTIVEGLVVGALQPGFIIMAHQLLTSLPYS